MHTLEKRTGEEPRVYFLHRELFSTWFQYQLAGCREGQRHQKLQSSQQPGLFAEIFCLAWKSFEIPLSIGWAAALEGAGCVPGGAHISSGFKAALRSWHRPDLTGCASGAPNSRCYSWKVFGAPPAPQVVPVLPQLCAKAGKAGLLWHRPCLTIWVFFRHSSAAKINKTRPRLRKEF